MGADRKLARWPRIVEYFKILGESSGRIMFQELGKTAEGRPFIAAVLTSEANMAKLEEFRTIQARLADPRRLGEAEAKSLIDRGRAVVMISCSIHATEVGGTQMSSELAYDLVIRDDETTRQILDNVIFILVPSLNPDGLEMVAGWYESTLGTPHEGVGQPFLYHKYVGHDNNRDWFMFTQPESRLTVEKVHNVWHPMIVYDQHQMASDSFRLFLPPYIDPFDQNVDPMLQHETTVLGSEMMHELLSNGKTGITHSIIFDCFSPSRAYQHYHGGVRILSEAASCKIATPIKIKFEEIEAARDGSDPKTPSVAHPLPWRGGEWRLRDIVEYDKLAAIGCLKHAARYRREWVKNFYEISKRAVETRKPYAFIVPAHQSDPVTAYEMLDVLQKGMVEIHRAKAPFEAGGVGYPKGTYVILMAQPYGRYANTLLERQEYPDLRVFPGGPPKPPYDITAHTLPLQMGVACVEVKQPFEADLELVPEVSMPVAVPAGKIRSAGAVSGYSMCNVMNSSFKAINKLQAAGYDIYRHMERTGPPGRDPYGTFYIPYAKGIEEVLEECAHDHGVRVGPVSGDLDGAPVWKLNRSRVAMYVSYLATADEGWTRFIFDDYGIPYASVHDADVCQGGHALRSTYDCLIIPGQGAEQIARGIPEGRLFPQYTGGLGEQGRAAVRDFVEAGGTLITLGPSCEWATVHLGLRLRNVTAGLKSQDYYLPGSLMRVLLDPSHPVAYGMPRETCLLAVQSPAYDVTEGTVVGRYAPTRVPASGWVLGAKYIEDKAVIVDVPLGKGRVILLAPRVQFRAQTRGAYRLLFNSIFLASAEKTRL